MAITVTQAQAHDNIEQGVQACQKLLILLEDERSALKDRSTQELERIIKDKSTCLIALEQTAKQRMQWCNVDVAEAGLDTAWTLHIEQLDPQLLPQWQRFKSLLEDCRTHNEINGKMLARNQQVFKRLVAIVRGQTDQQPLYSAKGNRGAMKAYQKLGEA